MSLPLIRQIECLVRCVPPGQFGRYVYASHFSYEASRRASVVPRLSGRNNSRAWLKGDAS